MGFIVPTLVLFPFRKVDKTLCFDSRVHKKDGVTKPCSANAS